MNISLLQETLEKGLSLASPGLAVRAQLPILSHFLVKAQKSHLTLISTNLEISLAVKLGSQVKEEGTLALPGRTFLEIVHALPHNTVHLTAQKHRLDITSGKVHSTLSGMDPAEFPAIPQSLSQPLVTLEKSQLEAIVNQVSFAASTDESRPTLTGVLFLPNSKVWQIVATDGFRLSLTTLPSPASKNKTFSASKTVKWLVPARALQEFVRLAKDTPETTIQIGTDTKNNQIIFATDNIVFTSRLIEGDFPDFAKIIPSGFPTQATFDKEEFLRAVRLASIFAREAANLVRLKVGGGEIIIAADSKIGKNQASVATQVKGEGGEMAFNYRYLLDYLQAVSGDTIVLEMKDSTSPGLFRSEAKEEKDLLHLIMPIRLQT